LSAALAWLLRLLRRRPLRGSHWSQFARDWREYQRQFDRSVRPPR
jgi:hypothetical protein